MIWLAAASAGVAAGIWWPVPAAARLRAAQADKQRSRWQARLLIALALAVFAAVVAVGWGPGAALLGITATILVGTVVAVVRLHLAARRERAARTAVAAACRSLAGLIDVGHLPTAALGRVAAEYELLHPVAAIGELGGDIPTALRQEARRPGQRGLVPLAVAWDISISCGASLGPPLNRVSEALEQEAEVAADLEAELAGPKASSRVLAVLPLAGAGLGFLFGGNPIIFLTTGLVGPICCCAGVGLAAAGVLWTEHMAASAKRHADMAT